MAINVLAWIKPASAAERDRRVHEDILRWEDDGGPVFEVGNSFFQVAEDQLRRFPVVNNDNKIAEMVDQANMAIHAD